MPPHLFQINKILTMAQEVSCNLLWLYFLSSSTAYSPFSHPTQAPLASLFRQHIRHRGVCTGCSLSLECFFPQIFTLLASFPFTSAHITIPLDEASPKQPIYNCNIVPTSHSALFLPGTYYFLTYYKTCCLCWLSISPHWLQQEQGCLCLFHPCNTWVKQCLGIADIE